jgi:putative SOS response-associated peptidase YedK
MCNRYRAMGQAALADYARKIFGLEWDPPSPRFNIGPNQIVPIFVLDDEPKTVATEARWNLIPAFEPGGLSSVLRTNARSEEVLTKPSYRDAIQRRRCLVPCDGFYEWEHLQGGRVKLPWAFELPERRPFTMAGLWERGNDARPPTFTILTTRPNDLVARIHNRMPVMLPDDAAHRWIASGPMTKESLAPFIEPFPSEAMRSYRVNPLLNSVRQESAEAAAPATADQVSRAEGDAAGQGELPF